MGTFMCQTQQYCVVSDIIKFSFYNATNIYSEMKKLSSHIVKMDNE